MVRESFISTPMQEHGPCRECGNPGVMGFYKYATGLQDEQRWALCLEHLPASFGEHVPGSRVIYDEEPVEMTPEKWSDLRSALEED